MRSNAAPIWKDSHASVELEDLALLVVAALVAVAASNGAVSG
jgi:hypothetical protein